MAWTAPKDWAIGEIVTAATMTAQVKNNFRYLKGIDGVPTIQAGIIIDNTLGSEYLKLPPLTTAQSTVALATTTGRMIYDGQSYRIKFYDGTAIRSVISTADVHDTAVNGATFNPISSNNMYAYRNLVTATGDIRYATAPGVETRLALGTAGTVLVAGAAAPEWAAKQALITSGTYTGDNNADRAIPHGLGLIPKIVFIVTTSRNWRIATGIGQISRLSDETQLAVTAPDATNFYVGNAASYDLSANWSTGPVVYTWVAIG